MSFTIANASVAAALKQETSVAHQRAEQALHPLLSSIRSAQDYARMLRMFYGFFFPLQQSIAHHVTEDALEDVRERRSADLILDDLRALNISLQSTDLCTLLPRIDTLPSAMGALYVMEGSTLGGRMIANMLLRNPDFPVPDGALHFFRGYGEDTGLKWKTFLQAINLFDEDTEAIVRAANETFSTFSNWIKANLYS